MSFSDAAAVSSQMISWRDTLQQRIDALQLFSNVSTCPGSDSCAARPSNRDANETSSHVYRGWSFLESPVAPALRHGSNTTPLNTTLVREEVVLSGQHFGINFNEELENSAKPNGDLFQTSSCRGSVVTSVEHPDRREPDQPTYLPDPVCNQGGSPGSVLSSRSPSTLGLGTSPVEECATALPFSLTDKLDATEEPVSLESFSVASTAAAAKQPESNASSPWNSSLGSDDAFDTIRRFREALDAVIMTFNRAGVATALSLLGKCKLLDSSNATSVAAFLFFIPGLDKQNIGKFLGGHLAFNNEVLQRFLHLICFAQVDLVTAIRLLFSKFQPPGESQELFRIVNAFSVAYAQDNAAKGYAADQVALLTYAVLMLHTDRHNARVRRKMSKEEFVKLVPQSHSDTSSSSTNSSGTGYLFERKFLEAIYDDVVSAEFRILLSDSDIIYGKLSKHSGVGILPKGTISSSRSSRLEKLAGKVNDVDQDCRMKCGKELTTMDDRLKAGVTFVKYCRNGTLKLRVIKLSQDGSRLLWTPVGDTGTADQSAGGKKQRRFLWLRDVIDVTIGSAWSPAFRKSRLPQQRDASCCSIHALTRTLDLCAPLDLTPPVEVWASAILFKSQLLRQSLGPSCELEEPSADSRGSKRQEPFVSRRRMGRMWYNRSRNTPSVKVDSAETASVAVERNTKHPPIRWSLPRCASRVHLRRAHTFPGYRDRGGLLDVDFGRTSDDGTGVNKKWYRFLTEKEFFTDFDYDGSEPFGPQRTYQGTRKAPAYAAEGTKSFSSAVDTKVTSEASCVTSRTICERQDLGSSRRPYPPATDVLDDYSTSSTSTLSSPELKKDRRSPFKASRTGLPQATPEELERVWKHIIIPNWASHWDVSSPLATQILTATQRASAEQSDMFRGSPNVPMFLRHLLPPSVSPIRRNDLLASQGAAATYSRWDRAKGAGNVAFGTDGCVVKDNAVSEPTDDDFRQSKYPFLEHSDAVTGPLDCSARDVPPCVGTVGKSRTVASENVLLHERGYHPFESKHRTNHTASVAWLNGSNRDAVVPNTASFSSAITSAASSSFLQTLPSLPFASERLMSAMSHNVDSFRGGVSRATSARRSTVLPVSFAARLDAIRKAATREPAGFFQLMSGTLRVGCLGLDAMHPPSSSASMTVPDDFADDAYSLTSSIPEHVQRSLCYWEPEYLKSPGLPVSYHGKRNFKVRATSRRWPTVGARAALAAEGVAKNGGLAGISGVTHMKPPFPDIPLAAADIANYSDHLSRISLPLLSLWWAGLPVSLRPTLWLLALTGTTTTPLVSRFGTALSYLHHVNTSPDARERNDFDWLLVSIHGVISRCTVTRPTTPTFHANAAAGWLQSRKFDKKRSSCFSRNDASGAPPCIFCSAFRRFDATRDPLPQHARKRTTMTAYRMSLIGEKITIGRVHRSLAHPRRQRCESAPCLSSIAYIGLDQHSSDVLLSSSQLEPSRDQRGEDLLSDVRGHSNSGERLARECCDETLRNNAEVAYEACRGNHRMWRCAIAELCVASGHHRREVCSHRVALVHLAAVVTAVTSCLPLAFHLLNAVVSSQRLPVADLLMLTEPSSARRTFSRFQLFQVLFSERLPLLFKHFKALELSPEFYLPHWFGRLFSGIVPLHCLVRLWDRVLLGGETVLFQIGLGLLHYYELQFLNTSFEGCLRLLLQDVESDREHQRKSYVEDLRKAVDGSTTEAPDLLKERRDTFELQRCLDFDDMRFWRCVDQCTVDPVVVRFWMDATCRSQEAAHIANLIAKHRSSASSWGGRAYTNEAAG